MRQIKFRGKLLDNGEWIYGDVQQWDNLRFGMTCMGTINIPYEVNPDTVGQFTGLHDKNGREIYEGDILNVYDTTQLCGVVEYHDKTAAFDLSMSKIKNKCLNNWIDYLMLYVDHQYRYEIVGNIHDNPELLKEGPTPQKTQEEEIQIGDVIEVGGEKYIAEEATEGQDCDCCDLMDFSNCLQLCGHCSSDYRKDGNDLLFKKIGGKK